MAFDIENALNELPRKDLQRLAKSVGVKANGKSAEIVANLVELHASNAAAFSTDEVQELLPALTSGVNSEPTDVPAVAQQQGTAAAQGAKPADEAPAAVGEAGVGGTEVTAPAPEAVMGQGEEQQLQQQVEEQQTESMQGQEHVEAPAAMEVTEPDTTAGPAGEAPAPAPAAAAAAAAAGEPAVAQQEQAPTSMDGDEQQQEEEAEAVQMWEEEEQAPPAAAPALAGNGAGAFSNPLFDDDAGAEGSVEKRAAQEAGAAAAPASTAKQPVDKSLARVQAADLAGGAWSPGCGSAGSDAERRAWERGRKSGLWQGTTEVQMKDLESQWGKYKENSSSGSALLGNITSAANNAATGGGSAVRRGWKIPDLTDVRAKGAALKGAGFTTVSSPFKGGARKPLAAKGSAATTSRAGKNGKGPNPLGVVGSRLKAKTPSKTSHVDRAKLAEEAFKARRAAALAKQQGAR